MTGPEQHANTVRLADFAVKANYAETGGTLVMYSDLRWLVALAERADTLERERDEAREAVEILRDKLEIEREQARAEADRLRALLADVLADIETFAEASGMLVSDPRRISAALAGPQTEEPRP